MDFRTSATKELSTLLDHLVQAADAAAKVARDEGAAEAKLAADAAAQVARDEAAAESKLAAEAAAKAARDEVAAKAKVASDALTARLAAVDGELAAVRQNLSEQKEARGALERAAVALESEKARLKQQTDALQTQIAALQQQIAAREDEAEQLRADLAAVRGDLATARAEIESTQAASEALLEESNAAQQALHAQLDEAHRQSVETTARASEWRVEQARSIRDQAVALVSRTLDRMLAVSAAFAAASTEDEALAAVVEALATEFSRVVLFKVSLDRLDVIRHAGFDFPADYTHLVIPQPIGSMLDRAVTSGQIELLAPDVIGELNGTPFGGTPACALALPIDLEGDTCAVVYADDSDQPHQAFAATELRRTFAMLVRQLAIPLLVRLPAEMKAITELRAYAAHLVAELENMYDADVSTHRKGSDLRRRLHDNLECARGIYAQRVSSEPAAAAGLLEAELVLAASVAHATPFGRDLTALLGAAEPRVAEA